MLYKTLKEIPTLANIYTVIPTSVNYRGTSGEEFEDNFGINRGWCRPGHLSDGSDFKSFIIIPKNSIIKIKNKHFINYQSDILLTIKYNNKEYYLFFENEEELNNNLKFVKSPN